MKRVKLKRMESAVSADPVFWWRRENADPVKVLELCVAGLNDFFHIPDNCQSITVVLSTRDGGPNSYEIQRVDGMWCLSELKNDFDLDNTPWPVHWDWIMDSYAQRQGVKKLYGWIEY